MATLIEATDKLHHMCTWTLDEIHKARTKYEAIITDVKLSDEEKSDLKSVVHDVIAKLWSLVQPLIDHFKEMYPNLWHLIEWVISVVKVIKKIVDADPAIVSL